MDYVLYHVGNNIAKWFSVAICFGSFFVVVVAYTVLTYRYRRKFWYNGVRLPSRPNQPYWYLVTVSTGFRPWAGHEGDVFLRLIGTRGESHIFLVNGETYSRLQEAESHLHILSCAQPLGEINSVVLICGATESRKRWFLSSVHIAYISEGLDQGKNWYFPYHEWIEVFFEPVKVTLSAVDVNHDINRRLLLGWLGRSFTDFHLWTSLFFPLKYTRFRRSERVLCSGSHAISATAVCLFLNFLVPNLGAVVLGLFTSCTTAIPIYFFEWMFRISKRRPLIVVEDINWYRGFAVSHPISYNLKDLVDLEVEEIFCLKDCADENQRFEEFKNYKDVLENSSTFWDWLDEGSSTPFSFPVINTPSFTIKPTLNRTSYLPTSTTTNRFSTNTSTSLSTSYDPGSDFQPSYKISKSAFQKTNERPQKSKFSNVFDEQKSNNLTTPSISSSGFTSKHINEDVKQTFTTSLQSNPTSRSSFKISKSSKGSTREKQSPNLVKPKLFDVEPKAMWRVNSNYSLSSIDSDEIDFNNFEMLETIPVSKFKEIITKTQAQPNLESALKSGGHIYRKLVGAVSDIDLPFDTSDLSVEDEQLVSMIYHDHCLRNHQWIKPNVPIQVFTLDAGIRFENNWMKIDIEEGDYYKKDSNLEKLLPRDIENKYPEPIPRERIFSMVLFENYATKLSAAYVEMSKNPRMMSSLTEIFTRFVQAKENLSIFYKICIEISILAEGRQTLCAVFSYARKSQGWLNLVYIMAQRLLSQSKITEFLRIKPFSEISSSDAFTLWKKKLEFLKLSEKAIRNKQLTEEEIFQLSRFIREMILDIDGCVVFFKILEEDSTDETNDNDMAVVIQFAASTSSGIEKLAALYKVIGHSSLRGRQLLLQLYSTAMNQQPNGKLIFMNVANYLNEVPTGKRLLSSLQKDGKNAYLAALRFKNCLYQELSSYVTSATQCLSHVIVSMNVLVQCMLSAADHANGMLDRREFLDDGQNLIPLISKGCKPFSNKEEINSIDKEFTNNKGHCRCASVSQEPISCLCGKGKNISSRFSDIKAKPSTHDNDKVQKNQGNQGSKDQKNQGKATVEKHEHEKTEKEEKVLENQIVRNLQYHRKRENTNKNIRKANERNYNKFKEKKLKKNQELSKIHKNIGKFNENFLKAKEHQDFYLNFNERPLKCCWCPNSNPRLHDENSNISVNTVVEGQSKEFCRNCANMVKISASKWGRNTLHKHELTEQNKRKSPRLRCKQYNDMMNCQSCLLGQRSDKIKLSSSFAIKPKEADETNSKQLNQTHFLTTQKNKKFVSFQTKTVPFPSSGYRFLSLTDRPWWFNDSSNSDNEAWEDDAASQNREDNSSVECPKNYIKLVPNNRPITASDLRKNKKLFTDPIKETYQVKKKSSSRPQSNLMPSSGIAVSKHPEQQEFINSISNSLRNFDDIEYCERTFTSASIKRLKNLSYTHRFKAIQNCQKQLESNKTHKISSESEAENTSVNFVSSDESMVSCTQDKDLPRQDTLLTERSPCSTKTHNDKEKLDQYKDTSGPSRNDFEEHITCSEKSDCEDDEESFVTAASSDADKKMQESTCKKKKERSPISSPVLKKNFHQRLFDASFSLEMLPSISLGKNDKNQEDEDSDYFGDDDNDDDDDDDQESVYSDSNGDSKQITKKPFNFQLNLSDQSVKPFSPLITISSYIEEAKKYGEKTVSSNISRVKEKIESNLPGFGQQGSSEDNKITSKQQNTLLGLLGIEVIKDKFSNFSNETRSSNKVHPKQSYRLENFQNWSNLPDWWRMHAVTLRLLHICVDVFLSFRVLIARRKQDTLTPHEKLCQKCLLQREAKYLVSLHKISDLQRIEGRFLGIRYSEMLPTNWREKIRTAGLNDKAIDDNQRPTFYRSLLLQAIESTKIIVQTQDKTDSSRFSSFTGQEKQSAFVSSETESLKLKDHMNVLSHFKAMISSLNLILKKAGQVRQDNLVNSEDMTVAAGIDLNETSFNQSIKSVVDKSNTGARTIVDTLTDYVKEQMHESIMKCDPTFNQPWKLPGNKKLEAARFLSGITTRIKKALNNDDIDEATLDNAVDSVIESFLGQYIFKIIVQTSIVKATKQARKLKQYLANLETISRLCLAKILAFADIVSPAIKNTRRVMKECLEEVEVKSSEREFSDQWWKTIEKRGENQTDIKYIPNGPIRTRRDVSYSTIDDVFIGFERLRRYVRYDLCLANCEILSMENLIDKHAISLPPKVAEGASVGKSIGSLNTRVPSPKAGKYSTEEYNSLKSNKPDDSSRENLKSHKEKSSDLSNCQTKIVKGILKRANCDVVPDPSGVIDSTKAIEVSEKTLKSSAISSLYNSGEVLSSNNEGKRSTNQTLDEIVSQNQSSLNESKVHRPISVSSLPNIKIFSTSEIDGEETQKDFLKILLKPSYKQCNILDRNSVTSEMKSSSRILSSSTSSGEEVVITSFPFDQVTSLKVINKTSKKSIPNKILADPSTTCTSGKLINGENNIESVRSKANKSNVSSSETLSFATCQSASESLANDEIQTNSNVVYENIPDEKDSLKEIKNNNLSEDFNNSNKENLVCTYSSASSSSQSEINVFLPKFTDSRKNIFYDSPVLMPSAGYHYQNWSISPNSHYGSPFIQRRYLDLSKGIEPGYINKCDLSEKGKNFLEEIFSENDSYVQKTILQPQFQSLPSFSPRPTDVASFRNNVAALLSLQSGQVLPFWMAYIVQVLLWSISVASIVCACYMVFVLNYQDQVILWAVPIALLSYGLILEPIKCLLVAWILFLARRIPSFYNSPLFIKSDQGIIRRCSYLRPRDLGMLQGDLSRLKLRHATAGEIEELLFIKYVASKARPGYGRRRRRIVPAAAQSRVALDLERVVPFGEVPVVKVGEGDFNDDFNNNFESTNIESTAYKLESGHKISKARSETSPYNKSSSRASHRTNTSKGSSKDKKKVRYN